MARPAHSTRSTLGALLRIAPPWLLLVLTLALYLSTLAPGMTRGDSGEFQWAMASLNVAHATGYPLFTLLGHAWLAVPIVGSAAWRLNLLAAFFGAAAVAVLFVFTRALTRQTAAAVAASLFLALAPVFWFNASILEVYTLNTLFLALILFFLWRWSLSPKYTLPLYLAFFILGLSLAHHRMTILALPGIAVFMLAVDWRTALDWRRIALLALLVIPGLLLYLYVPVRLLAVGESMHYAIFDIILGQEYSNSLLREFHPFEVLLQIPFQNFGAGLALAALGLYAQLHRARPLALLLLLVYFFDAGFALIYSVPDVEVFLTPSFLVIAIWIAVGTASLLDWIASHVPRQAVMPVSIAAALVFIALPANGLKGYGHVGQRVSQEAGPEETRARQILGGGLPSGALLELDWETATAIRFIQATEGTRSDLEARLIKVNTHDEYFLVLKNAEIGRPIYIERGVNWIRAVSGYRVDNGPLDLAQIIKQPVTFEPLDRPIDDRVTLAGMQSNSHGLTLYWKAERPIGQDLATYVHYFDSNGRPLGQEDHAACCQPVYSYKTSEWPVGISIADSFRPAPAQTSYLQLGMYSQAGGELQTFGRTLYLQTLPVTIPERAPALNIGLGNAFIARSYVFQQSDASIELEIYWEAKAAVTTGYKMFVHLTAPDGNIVAQVDRAPVNGVYPTFAWQPGQLVKDVVTLPNIQQGTKLEIGLYDGDTGRRLARDDGKGDTIEIQIR